MNITNEISILRGLTAGESLANINLDIIEQKFDEMGGARSDHAVEAMVNSGGLFDPVNELLTRGDHETQGMSSPYPSDEVPPNGH